MQDELPPAARAAVQRGHLIEAVKLVREHTGLSLKESKALVDRHARATLVAPAPSPDAFSELLAGGAPGFPAEAATALAEGRKLDAVKIVREATGLGLAESLQMVEARMRGEDGAATGGQGVRGGAGHVFDPMAEPGRVASGGSRTWLIVVAVLAVLAVAFVYMGG